MEVAIQVIDCDYIKVNNKPIIRIFGKTKEKKTVCVFFEGFFPYFYVLPKQKQFEKVVDFLKKEFKEDLVNIQVVKKYLPIGYRKDPEELLKITISDPSRIPTLRESLRKLKWVEEVFEADILFRYRFMADFKISGMKWIKVLGNPINTNTVKTDFAIQAEEIIPMESTERVGLKFMSSDIEVASEKGLPDPSEDQISIISLSFFPSFNGKNTLILVSKHVEKVDSDVLSFKNEEDMLKKFLEIVDEYDPDIITGYNCTNFDLPYIVERLKKLKLPRSFGRCIDKQVTCKKIRENRYKNSVPGRVIVDPYIMIKDMVKRGFFVGLKRYGLGDVSKLLLNEDKVDVKHSQIARYWNSGGEEFKKLLDYARKDSMLALRIVVEKGFLEKYIGISLVSGLLLQDALDSGESLKVENLLLGKFNEEGYVIPCKPDEKEVKRRNEEREKKGLKGAFVLEPQVGFHDKNVVYLDFASMYPSIFISFNICPTTLVIEDTQEETIKTPYGTKFISQKIREGIVPKILKVLLEERNKVKKEMKKEKDENKLRALDAKQEALKRIANAFYGYTGFLMARFYVLDIANAITSCGRYFIQSCKEIIDKETNYKVIYGDTDSVMVKTNVDNVEEAFRIGEEIASLINKKFEGKLKIKIESVFKTLLILSKKRYVGWSFEKVEDGWKDKIVMKGIETVRRDWCDLVGEVLENVLKTILVEKDVKKAVKYFKEVIEKLQRNEIPIEKLVITKGISKRLEDYKGVQPHIELAKRMSKRDGATAPGVGDRIGFVIVKGLRLISERAEDPEYVKEHGLEIDSKYYIEGQLIPPLERVFEALGIKKSELLGIGRQIGLIEAIKNNKEKVKNILNGIEGFVCSKCDRTYRRVPLIGKCLSCGGEIVFYLGNERSRYAYLPNGGSVAGDNK